MRGTTNPPHRPRRRAARLAPLALAALLLASPRSLPAQDAAGWLGKRVLLQFDSVLRVGDTVVDDQKREASGRGGLRKAGRIYRVDQVNGPWLWLQAEGEGAAGWILSAEVIPHDGAIDYFTNQIRANPANGNAYVSRGHIWRDKKEYNLALSDYNEAIRLDRGSEIAWCSRGIAWRAKFEYDKAIADYDEAIRLDSMFGLAYYNRGIAWDAKSERDRAIADYTEAIRLDREFALAFYNRGNAWRAKFEHDRAIADYTEAIRLDPKHSGAYHNRGLARGAKSEHEKAIADYTEAIRLDPKLGPAYNDRGVSWGAKSEYDRAIADYTEAIRLHPKDALAYFNRAVLDMITRRDGAVAGMRTVVELEGGKGENAVYAVILGHLAGRIASDAEAAKGFLGPLARDLNTTGWPYPAVRFLRGDLDEARFLAMAADPDQRTEARCFLGLHRELEGRREESLAHYRWVKEYGTRSSVEYSIALAELARLESPAGLKPATPEAGVAKLLGTILYVPTPQMEARFGADPQPMADYVNALKARANAVLAEAEPTTARGLLVAVGIKAGRRSKVWCQPVEGPMPPTLVRTLERELGEVEAVALKAGPAGFGLQFGLNGKTPAEFPKFPGRWDDAAGAGRSKTLIPPDDLFKILWPD